uniref:Uncharacterized protein n=1 Tax=Arundo donax TaxID=35708 RepID=A0A0A9C4R9_ARUDO
MKTHVNKVFFSTSAYYSSSITKLQLDHGDLLWQLN